MSFKNVSVGFFNNWCRPRRIFWLAHFEALIWWPMGVCPGRVSFALAALGLGVWLDVRFGGTEEERG